MVMISYLFFFVKQKTAYEMRISDWSSDVCSSDLPSGEVVADVARGPQGLLAHARQGQMIVDTSTSPIDTTRALAAEFAARGALRSEERRGRQECVSTCRSRWSRDH